MIRRQSSVKKTSLAQKNNTTPNLSETAFLKPPVYGIRAADEPGFLRDMKPTQTLIPKDEIGLVKVDSTLPLMIAKVPNIIMRYLIIRLKQRIRPIDFLKYLSLNNPAHKAMKESDYYAYAYRQVLRMYKDWIRKQLKSLSLSTLRSEGDAMDGLFGEVRRTVPKSKLPGVFHKGNSEIKSKEALKIFQQEAQAFLADEKSLDNYALRLLWIDNGGSLGRENLKNRFDKQLKRVSPHARKFILGMAQYNRRFIKRMLKIKDPKSTKEPDYQKIKANTQQKSAKYYDSHYEQALNWLRQFAPYVLPMPIKKEDFLAEQQDQESIDFMKRNNIIPYITKTTRSYYYVVYSAKSPKNGTHQTFKTLLDNDTTYFHSQLKPFEVNITQPTYLGGNLSDIKAYAHHQVYQNSSDQDVLNNKVDTDLKNVSSNIDRQMAKIVAWFGDRTNTEGAYLADYLFFSAFDEQHNLHKEYPDSSSKGANSMLSKQLRKIEGQGFKAYAKEQLERLNQMIKTGHRPMTMAERAQKALTFERLMKIARESWKAPGGTSSKELAKISGKLMALSREVRGLVPVKITANEIHLLQDRLKLLSHHSQIAKVARRVDSLKLAGKLGKVVSNIGTFLDVWGSLYNWKFVKTNEFDKLAWPGGASVLPLLEKMSGFDRDGTGNILQGFKDSANRINRAITTNRLDSAQEYYEKLVNEINVYNRSQRKKGSNNKEEKGLVLGLVYTSHIFPDKGLGRVTGDVHHTLKDRKPGILAYHLGEVTEFERVMGVKLHQLHIGIMNGYTTSNIPGNNTFFETVITINLPSH